MSEEERMCDILSTIRKVEELKPPVSVYFDRNSVPFSLVQYHRYHRILKNVEKMGFEMGEKMEIT
ncbi:MAG: hypothetical protein U9Q68_08875 [Euryarchaeota archaeon]|nr:hypothetical protein [Euryarchaeota archaeon]